jgi:hypothetical protein
VRQGLTPAPNVKAALRCRARPRTQAREHLAVILERKLLKRRIPTPGSGAAAIRKKLTDVAYSGTEYYQLKVLRNGPEDTALLGRPWRGPKAKFERGTQSAP